MVPGTVDPTTPRQLKVSPFSVIASSRLYLSPSFFSVPRGSIARINDFFKYNSITNDTNETPSDSSETVTGILFVGRSMLVLTSVIAGIMVEIRI